MISRIQKRAITLRRVGMALPSLVFAAGVAQAAPPDAGILLDTVRPPVTLPLHDASALPEALSRPALKLDDSVKIAVTAWRITGAKAFEEAELNALMADAVGREATLDELNRIAQRITRHYQQAGYLLARAYLPAQDIKNGAVEIAILEGRLGKLHVENVSALANANVAARLAGIRENEALDGAALERGLLLLNDLPGVEVKSTLKPGTSVGTTDLDIQIGAKSLYAGSMEFDNFGNRYTGDLRLGGSFVAGNIAGIGDALALRALASDGMNYARVAWQAPVGDAGTQVGAAYSDMDYKLGKDFASLRAHGTAAIASLYALHPFQRSRIANINGQVNYDHKTLKDDIDSTATRNAKTLDILSFGLSGDRVDGLLGGGMTNWSASYVSGQLKLDAGNKALDDAGHRTAGGYGKLAANVSRQQVVVNGLNLFASVQAQQAAKNLDSSEKMSLGGAQGVRAYPQGEISADDAVLASVELRYAVAPAWQASVFYDAGQGHLNHSPIAADINNVRHISGAGLGLSYSLPGDLSVQATIAWRDGPQPTSDIDRSPRAWLQVIKRF